VFYTKSKKAYLNKVPYAENSSFLALPFACAAAHFFKKGKRAFPFFLFLFGKIKILSVYNAGKPPKKATQKYYLLRTTFSSALVLRRR